MSADWIDRRRVLHQLKEQIRGSQEVAAGASHRLQSREAVARAAEVARAAVEAVAAVPGAKVVAPGAAERAVDGVAARAAEARAARAVAWVATAAREVARVAKAADRDCGRHGGAGERRVGQQATLH